MISKKLVSFLCYVFTVMFLSTIQSLSVPRAAINKSKRIQGMLTQTQPSIEPDTSLKKSTSTEIDTDSLDSLIEEADKNVSQENKRPESATTAPKKVPSDTEPVLTTPAPVKASASKTSQEAKEPTQTDKIDRSQDAPSVEFHFENTDLQNVVSQIEEIFDVTFISDDIVTPPVQGAKSLKGNKISFKTQKALSRKDAWNLFVSFLDLAGFAVIPQSDPKIWKIAPIESAQKAALRSFIGVDPAILPNNDEIIRYVYFIENSSIDAIKGIIETLKPTTAPLIMLQESKAFILVDKAYNIKSLMQIIKELDKVNLPQTLSVLKLRRADAIQVKELYDTLSNNDDKSISARLFPARKQPTSLYFPENTRIFAEPRTNTLILLGPADAILKIEDFITKYIDVDSDKPYSPLKVYTLKYADAESVAAIMNNVTAFGKSTPAGQNGGVRGEDKYLKSMSFTPEKSTNRIIIRGDYEDYLKAVDIIAKLDEPQAQVAIEILIVSLTLNETRQLGTQLRSKIPSTGLTNSPKFQTSGFGIPGQAIIENSNQNAPGVQRLLGNLLSLIGATQAGSTLVSLGTDAFGVWGVFGVLESIANATVVANPFFVTTNKTPAKVEVGTTRRVATASVLGGGSTQTSQGDLKAALTVNIVPQINSDGMISLHLDIQYNDFTVANEPTDATTDQRQVVTDAIVADKEVLAIGGLIQNTTNDSVTKVPILGDIPILGWLFKNKVKVESKSNILILVSTRIINPEKTDVSAPITQEHINEYRNDLGHFERPSDRHDPVTRLFFGDGQKSPERQMDSFLFKRQDKSLSDKDLYTKEMSRDKRRKEAKKKKRLAKLQKKESESLLNDGAEQIPKGISL